jgi:glycosyltransferase involved in cell wall biosynthesis
MPYRDGASLRRGTLMAALAHARPVITTQPPEPIDELAHGAVWLVPPDDPTALAGAVRQLATDAGRRTELGQAAADLAGRFSWESISAQTTAYFRELVAADQRQRVG